MSFPGGSVVKNLPAKTGDTGLIPGSGRSPGEEEMATHSSILPGKFHGQRGLAGYIPWDQKESATEYTHTLHCVWASLVAQTVKNLPKMQETLIRSPSWEDPMEKGMATHSSIIAWRIPWTEAPSRLQYLGSQRVRHNGTTNTSNT